MSLAALAVLFGVGMVALIEGGRHLALRRMRREPVDQVLRDLRQSMK